MAAQLDVGALPPAELPAFRRQSRGQPEGMEQAVGVERVQVRAVAVLERVVASAQQADLSQWKWASPDARGLLDRSSAWWLEPPARLRSGGQ